MQTIRSWVRAHQRLGGNHTPSSSPGVGAQHGAVVPPTNLHFPL
jgi:hypothetical protein